MLIGIMLVFFVQTTGQPNILFYASTVLKSVGFQSNEAASLASTGVGVIKVISTIPATLFVDHLGSKTFLCIGTSLMSVSLVTMGLVTLNLHVNYTTVCKSQSMEYASLQEMKNIASPNETVMENSASINLSSRTSQWQAEVANTAWQNQTGWARSKASVTSQAASHETPATTKHSAVLKWLSLASLLVYIAAFSIGLGPSKYFSDYF